MLGHSPNFCIHVPVNGFYIPTIDLPILLQKNMWTDPVNIQIAHRHMNVEIWDRGSAIPRKGIHKWDFHCSALVNNGDQQAMTPAFSALFLKKLLYCTRIKMDILLSHHHS